jgi:hypothetical protein
VPVEKVLGTIVAERAFDVICLLIIFLLALILQFDVVMGSYQNIKNMQSTADHSGSYSGWIMIGVVILILLFVGWVFYTGRGKALLSKIKGKYKYSQMVSYH